MNLQQVLDALGQLTADECEIVRRRASALAALGGAVPGVAPPVATLADTGDDSLVLSCIIDTCRDLDQTPASILRAGREYRSFTGKVRYLCAALREPGMSRTQFQVVVSLGAQLLRRNMEELSLPVGSRSMMRQVHRMPGILDRAFPGYIACGMLHMLARPANKER